MAASHTCMVALPLQAVMLPPPCCSFHHGVCHPPIRFVNHPGQLGLLYSVMHCSAWMLVAPVSCICKDCFAARPSWRELTFKTCTSLLALQHGLARVHEFACVPPCLFQWHHCLHSLMCHALAGVPTSCLQCSRLPLQQVHHLFVTTGLSFRACSHVCTVAPAGWRVFRSVEVGGGRGSRRGNKWRREQEAEVEGRVQ